MSAAQRLDEVFGLPEGSEVYVLNDFKSSAYDAVRLFETLGLNQFRYIPFYPGAKDDGVARPLITFGEYDDQCHYLPRCMEKIIDVSIRTIDISTIVEIMLRLGLPDEKMHQVTAKYVKDLIALTREINHLNHNNESMRREMETVMQTVDEGIITLDARDNVLVFNAAAEKIFNLSSSDIVGRKISSLPSRLIEFLSYADIAQLVREGSFREDLYYRLNVLPLHLLPLRERRADILPLAREFYREMASSLPELPPFDVFFAGKLDELMQYDFPGNARQLRNVVEFLVCTSENGLCPDISPAFGEVVSSRPYPLEDEQIVLEALCEREKRGEASGRRSLAVATGLSEDRVKKALAILRERGSVEIRRGRAGIVLLN